MNDPLYALNITHNEVIGHSLNSVLVYILLFMDAVSFFDVIWPNIGATLSDKINDNYQTFYPAT